MMFKTKKNKRIVITIAILMLFILSWAGLTKMGFLPNFLSLDILCSGVKADPPKKNNFPEEKFYKPVIYLYPKKEQDVYVKLDYQGDIFAHYPDYDYKLGGWKVKAFPDGRIINFTDNKEYSYLFWEGESKEKVDWDLSKGFVVKGNETKEFLQKTLSKIGLTPKEYNEFIVYWYPIMQENEYNLIHFAEEQYTEIAPLKISPKPDCMLRVFMVFKPLDEPIKVLEQEFESFERKGFSVIEWGGAKIN